MRFSTLGNTKKTLFLAILGCVIILIPLFYFEFPPLGNLINHMMRSEVLRILPDDIFLHDYYVSNWKLIPNLMIDIFNVFVMKNFSVFLSTKILLGLSLFVSTAAVFLIYYSLYERLDFWPLSIFLVLYNGFVIWGFINYITAVSLFLLIIGCWLYFLKKNMHLMQVVVCGLLSILTFFCHIFPFILLCFTLVAFELNRLVYQKENFRNYVQTAFKLFWTLIIPTLLTLFYMLNREGQTGDLQPYYFDELRRGFSIPLMLFYNYHLNFDVFSFVMFVLIVGGLFVSFRLKLSPLFYAPVGVLALLHAFIPRYIGTHKGEADIRLILPLVFLFIATTKWELNNKLFNRVVFCFFASLFLVRMLLIVEVWDGVFKNEYKDIQKISELTTIGAKVGQLFIKPNQAEYVFMPYPSQYFGAFLTYWNKAYYGCFMANKNQQPIISSDYIDSLYGVKMCVVRNRTNYDQLDLPSSSSKNPFYYPSISLLDYILVLDSEDRLQKIPANLELIYASKHFKYLKVKK